MAALMMCVISVASGVVTKQFMLALTVWLVFCTGDIVRVISWKEAIKLDTSKIYPYLPFVIILAFLSYSTWKAMPADPPGTSAATAGSLISALCLAKIMMVFWGLNVLMSYVFGSQTFPMYFKEPPTGRASQIGVYMCKICGQHQMFLFLISLTSVVSGTVTKEYMLMLALHHLFLTCDVFRLVSWKGALNVDPAKLIPYSPIALALAYLSYTCWAAM